MNSSPLRNIWVITKREFCEYFISPVAYVFLVIFLLLAGFFTFMVGQDFFARNEASLGSFFLWHPWLYLFLVPAIAMRLWSEEKRTGTLELLLTLPITTGQAVVGKFLASWAFLIVGLILTFPIWLVPNLLGSPDNGAILCGYVGSALMAGGYLGIGCMASALSPSQVISFVTSVVLCLFTILAGFPPVTDFIQGLFPGNESAVDFVANLSVMTHFESLQRGVVHLRDLLFFISIAVLSLVITSVIIETSKAGLKREGDQSKPMAIVKLGLCILGLALCVAAEALVDGGGVNPRVFAVLFGVGGVTTVVGICLMINLKKYLIANAHIAPLVGVVIMLNLFALSSSSKIDLTENKIHTLSEGSKNILNRVAEERGEDKDAFKIDARLYFTRGDERVSPFVRQYAARVKELLNEYESASKGSIVFNEINPQPDTDEEDLARQDNITRMQIGLEEFAYIGLTLSYADKAEMISLLEQGPGGRAGGLRPEAMLEYDISSAITRLLKDESKAPTIGVMSPLQINGGFPPNLPPQMMRGQRPAPPWLLMRQLQASYGRDNIKTIDMSVPAIADDIDLLIVIHPKSISEKAQFAIDQYVLGGGKVAAFLDPNHALDQGPMGGFSPPTGSSSNLDKLLPAWGVNFTDNRVVADTVFALRPPQSGGSWLTALDIQTEGQNQNDPILQQLGPLVGVHFGAFIIETTQDDGPWPNVTTLLHSTTNSSLIDVSLTKGLLPLPSFQQSQATITKSFSATSGTNMLALKLTGGFKTAFPKGDPERPQPAKDANSTQPEIPDNSLKTVKKDANPVVVLVGDVDFLHDTNQQLDQFRGFRNSNMNFVLNLVDYLTGDEDLIRIRSLTNRSRPLKKLNEMKEAATAQIRKELEKTEQELEEAENKAQDVASKLQDQLRSAIQSGQSGVIRLQVSEEDRKKLEASQVEAEESRDRARKTIRRIKKQRREAENSLLNRIKWASTAGMPFLVTIFGVGLAVRNRKRTAAK